MVCVRQVVSYEKKNEGLLTFHNLLVRMVGRNALGQPDLAPVAVDGEDSDHLGLLTDLVDDLGVLALVPVLGLNRANHREPPSIGSQAKLKFVGWKASKLFQVSKAKTEERDTKKSYVLHGTKTGGLSFSSSTLMTTFAVADLSPVTLRVAS